MNNDPDIESKCRRPPRIVPLAVGTVACGDCTRLLEWVAQHRVTGFDRIYIADAQEDDSVSSLLASLDKLGVVIRVPLPASQPRSARAPGLADILRRHVCEADWIVFIDIDEFILPIEGSRQGIKGMIPASLAACSGQGDAMPFDGLLFERLDRRVYDEHADNPFYRPIGWRKLAASQECQPERIRLDGFGVASEDEYTARPADAWPVFTVAQEVRSLALRMERAGYRVPLSASSGSVHAPIEDFLPVAITA
jgi:hypothetical protein